VPGALAYRKENKDIYVRRNGTWNALALKSKVLNLHKGNIGKMTKILFQH
jgi:hypothetical protein